MATSKLPQKGKVKILIHNSPNEEGQKPVYVGLNGAFTKIPRDKEVVVDVALLHGPLKDAVLINRAPGKDGQGTGKTKLVPRFTYQVIEIVQNDDAPKKAESQPQLAAGKAAEK